VVYYARLSGPATDLAPRAPHGGIGC
jgi:hypothetical protein